ncbi:MAG: DUF1080 domain-containing protein [Acidobacteria bacterium]|nr:DUF1080 domain-containing protein [Acidobacteriota bacterium]
MPVKRLILFLCCFSSVFVITTVNEVPSVAGCHIFAQDPPPPPPQKMPDPMVDDDSGFESIFDGKSLKDWDGDPTYWSVADGSLVGEIKPETIIKYNRFIIWRGGETTDFELKLEYRISERGNSGINYRSTELPGIKWVMRGYQADIDGQNRYTGQNYEERGRTFLALRGQYSYIGEGKTPRMMASVGDSTQLKEYIKGDWNLYHLIVRGNLMIHILNGHVMSVVLDDDVRNRRMSGKLGMQVHVGPPMKVEFRNIRLKKLTGQ